MATIGGVLIMSIQSSIRFARSFSKACLLAGISAISLAAWAEEPTLQALEAQIQRLEAQHQAEMQALRAEIDRLKAAQAAQATQAPQLVQDEPPGVSGKPPPKLIESPTHQFGLSSADGANTIAILARLHFDYGNYFKVTPDGGKNGVGPGAVGAPLDSGINARRARIGIGGVIESDWAYRLIYDLGNSADSTTAGVSGGVSSGVENAMITYNGFYKKENTVPIAIDAGYMDVPFTLDEATSSNDIMFPERSSSQVVATQFGGGDFRSAAGLRSDNGRYWAGLYLTGPTAGTPHHGADTATYSVFGRASYQILQNDDLSLHVGGNAMHLFQPRATATTTSATSVTSTISPISSLTLSDRPESRVDPTNILNTGAIPASSGTVEGAEAALGWKGLFVQGEYFHYSVDQYAGGLNPVDGTANKVAPTLNFQGGYAEASYSFGGQRRYVRETGAYSGVIPDHPFTIGGGGMGALELAARYSTVNLNDHFTPGQAPHLTGGIDGGDQTSYELGINWYPNTNMRMMLDYLHTDVTDLYKPVTTGKAPTALAGSHIEAITGRLQLTY